MSQFLPPPNSVFLPGKICRRPNVGLFCLRGFTEQLRPELLYSILTDWGAAGVFLKILFSIIPLAISRWGQRSQWIGNKWIPDKICSQLHETNQLASSWFASEPAALCTVCRRASTVPSTDLHQRAKCLDLHTRLNKKGTKQREGKKNPLKNVKKCRKSWVTVNFKKPSEIPTDLTTD